MDYFIKDSESHHRTGVLVILPMRPEILDFIGRDKVIASIEKIKLKFPTLPLLDLHAFLESERFVDVLHPLASVLHPDREGANRISDELSKFLRKECPAESTQQ